MGSVIDLMSSSGKMKIVTDAIKSAQMVDLLKSDGPFTVFAPIDLAVAQGPAGKFRDVRGDREQFQLLVKYHIVKGSYTTSLIQESLKKKNHLELETLCGKKLILKYSGFFRSHIKVNEASIVSSDLLADNGIVHTIDTVLFPP
ncbi:MAG: fasciclin domain-containing protein [Candidatus Thermoplasmatota archaeon]|jgi:uncharacterized surface protein with fasciclin (FAS1) repeats|nr:fasciclin domain-containing protein [Candidatus Thermoplasmatota archaeon]MCL5955593.1 fasciclin domain-containing protein [Candidatus Thermoplasmatota archaeon]